MGILVNSIPENALRFRSRSHTPLCSLELIAWSAWKNGRTMERIRSCSVDATCVFAELAPSVGVQSMERKRWE